jgi:hypothetical protein
LRVVGDDSLRSRRRYGLQMASTYASGVRIKYFQTEYGYLAVTNERPRGFKDVLFIGKSGTDPLKVEEVVIASEQLNGLPEIAKADMPAAWVLAFGYESPIMPQPEQVEEWPLLDDEGENLVAYIPVRRSASTVCQFRPWPAQIGLVIGLLIAIICLMLGII